MIRFTATTVAIEDTEDYVLVGFAEGRDGDGGEALHFQRSHEFDEQDAATGMDQVYVERNDQRQCGYGGIRRVELRPDRLTVRLDEPTSDHLGDDAFEIELRLSPAEFGRLRDGLRAVFRGFETLAEVPG